MVVVLDPGVERGGFGRDRDRFKLILACLLFVTLNSRSLLVYFLNELLRAQGDEFPHHHHWRPCCPRCLCVWLWNVGLCTVSGHAYSIHISSKGPKLKGVNVALVGEV